MTTVTYENSLCTPARGVHNLEQLCVFDCCCCFAVQCAGDTILTMTQASAKKRQGSKKNKKAWRKTDIQDVEEFLEDKRLEERLGVPFSDRKDEELFTIDTAPDEKNLQSLQDCKRDRRKEFLSRPPRCFQILQPDSKVPDPISKRNRIRSAEERKHPLSRVKEVKRLEKGILKAKEIDRIRNRKVDEKRRQSKPIRGEFGKDLWDEAPAAPVPPELNSEWIEPVVRKHTLVNSGMKQKAVNPKAPFKPHVIPTIEAPHPGTSYNPSFPEHLDLLQKIAEKEEKLIKEEKHIKRVTTLMFKKLPQREAEAQWMKEMSEGVPTLDPEAAKPDDINLNDDSEYHAINPPTNRDKKKDMKTRRKAREEKAKQAERLLSKVEQKKLSDLYRIKKLEQNLLKAEEKSKKLQEKRLAKKALRVTETKRLGRNKFEDKEMEFNLASELKGSLRSLKPEGNLLADRYVSLQKRNIMEVAARQNPRSAKKKRFLKASHKMAWEVHPLQRQSHQKKKHSNNIATLGQN